MKTISKGTDEEEMDQWEITVEELDHLAKNEYYLIDVRDEISYYHGHIPKAVHVELAVLFEQTSSLPKDKKIILYCMKGILTEDAAKNLSEGGFDAYHLTGGYGAWLKVKLKKQQEKEYCEEIEKSIRKKFHKTIFSKFAKAINQYQMLSPGDKIAVCISGGKDSMLMAKLFQELKRHNKIPFELVFLVMDPGYDEINKEMILNNAKLLQIPVTVFETSIFDAVFNIEKSPCYLCARMRRGYLYSKAKELGCNKIALGHHYDDVIETIVMGMMYGAQIQTMMPKLHSTNFPGMELIRPMYLIREDDIRHWCSYNDLHFIQCACRFTDTCSVGGEGDKAGSKRMEVKHLIHQLKKTNPFVEANIFKSVENVSLNTIIAYKKDGVTHHFLDSYQ